MKVVVGVQVDVDKADADVLMVPVGAGRYVVQRSPGSKEAKALVGQAVGVTVGSEYPDMPIDGVIVMHGPTIVSVPGSPERVVKSDRMACASWP